MMRLTDIDLLSSILATSSQIRSRKCLRTQSMTKRFGASSLSVLGSCSTCSGKIQVLSCCSLISPSREEIHCCQIGFNWCLFVFTLGCENCHSQLLCPSARPNHQRGSAILIQIITLPGAGGSTWRFPEFSELRGSTDNIILIHSPRKEAKSNFINVLPAFRSGLAA